MIMTTLDSDTTSQSNTSNPPSPTKKREFDKEMSNVLRDKKLVLQKISERKLIENTALANDRYLDLVEKISNLEEKLDAEEDDEHVV